MLHSFTVSNFLSFPYFDDLKTTGYSKEPVKPSVSFDATNYSHKHSENIFKEHGLLKTIALIGHGFSGKTNLLRAIERLQSIVIRGSVISEDYMPNWKFKEKETRFTIVFSKLKIKYVYSLEYKHTHITGESLYWFPHGRPVRVFDRDDLATENGMDVQIGPSFRNKKEFSFDYFNTPKDKLYLVESYNTCLENTHNRYSTISNAYDFIINDLVLFSSSNHWMNKDFNNYIAKIENNRELKQKYKEILPYFRLENVSTVKFSVESNHSYNPVSIDITYNGIPWFAESKSVLKTLRLATTFKYVLDKKKILFLDADIRLSDIITIESLFVSASINKASQLFFTTDSTHFFDMKRLRKDQIFIITLEKEHCSKIKRLLDIHLERNDKLQTLYNTSCI